MKRSNHFSWGGYLLFPFFLSIAFAQQCYWPNGDVADGYFSCNQGASVSNCCNLDAVCLDNGFCMDQKHFGNRLKRGACTDSSWGPSCQQLCKDTFPGGQASLILTGDFDPGTWCCGNVVNGKCSFASNGSNEPFTGPANGAVIYNRANGSTGPNATASAGQTLTVTATATVTSLSAATAMPGSSAGDTANNANITCPADHTTAVGAGLGASLGTIAVILAGLLFWQIKRRRDAEKKLNEMVVARPAMGYHQVGTGSGEVGKGGVNKPQDWSATGPGTVKHELPAGGSGYAHDKIEMRG